MGNRSAHEKYGEALRKAGLHETDLGQLWFSEAARALSQPLEVKLPYQEAGFFAPDKPRAAGLRFSVSRGHRLMVSFTILPDSARLFAELWSVDGSEPKLLKSADSTSLTYDADKDVQLLIRLQPELLSAVSYSLSISVGPSLAFPVSGGSSSDIGSVWGDDRDAGARRHEGIDIFGKRGTPVVAAADGIVTRVNEGGLGGKVVWMRPSGRNLSLYYAHLDSQLVRSGQSVTIGDTLGLMGNTGNARTTPPHLHFGIYTSGGAINPFPFVKPAPKLREPEFNTAMLGKVARTSAPQSLSSLTGGATSEPLPSGSYLEVQSVSDGHYRVVLPDGTPALFKKSVVAQATSLKSVHLLKPAQLLHAPFPGSAVIQQIDADSQVSILAYHGDFMYVSHNEVNGWLPRSSN